MGGPRALNTRRVGSSRRACDVEGVKEPSVLFSSFEFLLSLVFGAGDRLLRATSTVLALALSLPFEVGVTLSPVFTHRLPVEAATTPGFTPLPLVLLLL